MSESSPLSVASNIGLLNFVISTISHCMINRCDRDVRCIIIIIIQCKVTAALYSQITNRFFFPTTSEQDYRIRDSLESHALLVPVHTHTVIIRAREYLRERSNDVLPFRSLRNIIRNRLVSNGDEFDPRHSFKTHLYNIYVSGRRRTHK